LTNTSIVPMKPQQRCSVSHWKANRCQPYCRTQATIRSAAGTADSFYAIGKTFSLQEVDHA
jgi:hypothetical protein